MEKIEALEKCRDQWLWMAESGAKHKEEYFYLLSIDPDDIPDSECYCCEYDNQFKSNCCECPLAGYAWRSGCNSGGSFYREWNISKSESERKYWAKCIAEACNFALRYLNREL